MKKRITSVLAAVTIMVTMIAPVTVSKAAEVPDIPPVSVILGVRGTHGIIWSSSRL